MLYKQLKEIVKDGFTPHCFIWIAFKMSLRYQIGGVPIYELMTTMEDWFDFNNFTNMKQDQQIYKCKEFKKYATQKIKKWKTEKEQDYSNGWIPK